MEWIDPIFLKSALILAVTMITVGISIATYFAGQRSQVRTIKNDPLNVAVQKESGPVHIAMHERCATHSELAAHAEDQKRERENLHSKIGGVERGAAAKIDALRLEIKSDLALARHEAEARSHGIHERMNAIAEDMPVKVLDLLERRDRIKS